MIRNLLLFAIILSYTAVGTAQITLTDAHFPQVGDKLYTAIDTFPIVIITPPSATEQIWNFNGLEVEDFFCG